MPSYNPFTSMRVDMPNTNHFDLSFDNKLSFDMGQIIPVMVQDTLPGDHFSITPQMLIRFAPMVFPIMHKIDATIHFFYVPNRILWKNWKYFLAGENYAHPFIQGDTGPGSPLQVNYGSIWDYLGLPYNTNITEKIDPLPLYAIFKIFNEYYQDQNNDSNYQNDRDTLDALLEKNGQILPADFNVDYWNQIPIPNRAWEHDYFTSALPFAQKGDAVNIPIELVDITVEVGNAYKVADNTPATVGPVTLTAGGLIYDSDTPANNIYFKGLNSNVPAELAGTINDLRVAMQLQKFLEKNARSGTRYNELIMAHFGEDIGDARISRPEYVGGIQNTVVISEVLQTSQTTTDSALGDYAGHASTLVSGNTLHYSCAEHGWIIGLLSVRPKTAYFQGIPRKFSKLNHLDLYWKEFAQIGEQEILNKEIYYQSADNPNGTFGYIPRYSEYKYNPSEVHGQFRYSMLDWHLARYFAGLPTLNEEFIYMNPTELKRIFAVTDPNVQSLFAHIYFDVQAKRKVPFFTNPAGI